MKYWLAIPFAVIAIFVFALGVPALRRQHKVNRLSSYLHADVSSLDPRKEREFESILYSFINRPPISDPFSRRAIPLAFWKHSDGTFVFLERQLVTYPATRSARVTVFRQDGRTVSETKFPVGWNIQVETADRIWEGDERELTFVLNTRHVHDGADIAKQYFAIIAGAPVLIRLEDSFGNEVKNGLGEHQIGPTPSEAHSKQVELLRVRLDSILEAADN